ncbi:hypothetical protein [Patulibacter sp.]|uniref:hypothetical protein n=1 Tax=Patulibacter sp. TaxID=1912859 RepID=UPI00271A566D|nr:hypothetical protein [Patulibacter sp.]MDO9408361.1 hypothetical protein [Patulibacter sp.]
MAGHGKRVRGVAVAAAPAGVEVHVLEDDLVTTAPALPLPDLEGVRPPARVDAPGTAGDGHAGAPTSLRCGFVFCRHRPTPDDLGVAVGDRCRRKIRVPEGWLACPGRYEVEPSSRRRRFGRIRPRPGRDRPRG